ncbi:hypothetical protein Q9F39_004200 [Vibrio fluvialis]|nr:hypothetical protein [Vibrio fluvialis]
MLELNSFLSKTFVSFSWRNSGERKPLFSFLSSCVGLYQTSPTASGADIEWDLDSMAVHLNKHQGAVTSMIADTIHDLPDSPAILQLLEIIIDDWCHASNHHEIDDFVLGNAIETVAEKRNQIRSLLAENVYFYEPQSASIERLLEGSHRVGEGETVAQSASVKVL